MAFIDYYSEVAGTIPEMSPFLAKTFVNRARRDLYEARLWSFNQVEGSLFSPDQITTGTATVTLNSATVTLNAAATTALTGLTNPVITLRQIRFSSGPTYNIVSLSGSTLTLDRQYREVSSTTATLNCYRAFYGVP